MSAAGMFQNSAASRESLEPLAKPHLTSQRRLQHLCGSPPRDTDLSSCTAGSKRTNPHAPYRTRTSERNTPVKWAWKWCVNSWDRPGHFHRTCQTSVRIEIWGFKFSCVFLVFPFGSLSCGYFHRKLLLRSSSNLDLTLVLWGSFCTSTL